MAFDLRIIVTILVSVLACVIVAYFFFVYGAFRHPPIAVVLMLISAFIPVIMTAGVLPYDICVTGFTPPYAPQPSLLLGLNILYWLSFFLTWAVVPLIVSFLRYNHSLSLRNRLWLTLRENLIFYGVAITLVVAAVILLLVHKHKSPEAHTKTDFEYCKSIAVALANGYGLLVLCLCLGHGLVALPRKLWRLATPAARYLYALHRITRETKLTGALIADCDAAAVHCAAASERLHGVLSVQWEEFGRPRANALHRLKGEIPIPERFFSAVSENKPLARYRELQWADASTFEVEQFFSLLDDIIVKLEEAANVLKDSAQTALRALTRYNQSSARGFNTILRRIGAVVLGLINGIFVWGEISLAINKGKWSLFHFLSHRDMPDLVEILLLSTPLLTYLLFVGSWSLTHLKLGSFFRFTKACTNSNTLNYFAVILCRLGPTISFHYITQIGATGTQLMKVMGVMEEVIWIGGDWNIYAPILLGLFMIFFAFNIPGHVAECCGKDNFSFDYSMVDYDDLATGEEVLKELDLEARGMIEGGLKYTMILNGKKPACETNLSDPWGLDSSMEARLISP
jgi:hypothetical protein